MRSLRAKRNRRTPHRRRFPQFPSPTDPPVPFVQIGATSRSNVSNTSSPFFHWSFFDAVGVLDRLLRNLSTADSRAPSNRTARSWGWRRFLLQIAYACHREPCEAIGEDRSCRCSNRCQKRMCARCGACERGTPTASKSNPETVTIRVELGMGDRITPVPQRSHDWVRLERNRSPRHTTQPLPHTRERIHGKSSITTRSPHRLSRDNSVTTNTTSHRMRTRAKPSLRRIVRPVCL